MTGPQRFGQLVTQVLYPIAATAEPSTAERRLRQLHEIHPGDFHEAAGTTPDTCNLCDDGPR